MMKPDFDVCAQGFGGIRSARAYFDVKVFNPYTKSLIRNALCLLLYSSLEQLKDVYMKNKFVRSNIGFFPSNFCGYWWHRKGSWCTCNAQTTCLPIVCKMQWTIQFDDKLAPVSNQFSLLRSAIACIRSSCSSSNSAPCNVNLAVRETKLPMDPWLYLWICIPALYHSSFHLFKVAYLCFCFEEKNAVVVKFPDYMYSRSEYWCWML